MSSILLKNGLSIDPDIQHGQLISLGAVRLGQAPLRNPGKRFLPWFDSFQGHVFDRFLFNSVSSEGSSTIIALTALSNESYPFQEKRDTSGDLCFRTTDWDAAPVGIQIKIVISPVETMIGGHALTGFKYHYEGQSPDIKIHRFLDRQTWEVGGTTENLTIVCRSWLTHPKVTLDRQAAYSTAGFEHEIGCMPGNLWARWTLLPSFDLQSSSKGVLAAWFDEVSLIRTVIDKLPGDDALRCQDLHLFEEANSFRTNPKTVVFSPEPLDGIDLLNFWTELYDIERDKARAQFGITGREHPQITTVHAKWLEIDFATTYKDTVEFASELGMDNVMIDPIWQSGQTMLDAVKKLVPPDELENSVLKKLFHTNNCAIMDWEVDEIRGGKEGLKKLCDFAAEKKINIISWLATHMTPTSQWRDARYNQNLGRGRFGVFAAKESGLHPDTGYPGDCWALNLNTPVTGFLIDKIKTLCRETGLKGFLWDSFSNLGWWQLDYSNGTLRPQFAEMARLYAELANEGLYLMPEALCSFSAHSCLGLFGLNPYAGEAIGYSYELCTHLPAREHPDKPGHYYHLDYYMLKGQEPIDLLFQCVANKRLPNMEVQKVPGDERSPEAASEFKELFAIYKRVRQHMLKRTVLKNEQGVLWSNRAGEGPRHFFSFKDQTNPFNQALTCLNSSGHVAVGANCLKNRVYLVHESHPEGDHSMNP